MSELDKQVGGSHYKHYKIQPYEFFMANQIPHHKAAIIRRILRYDHPTGKGREDLEKIKHEVDLILELDPMFAVTEYAIRTEDSTLTVPTSATEYYDACDYARHPESYYYKAQCNCNVGIAIRLNSASCPKCGKDAKLVKKS